MMLSRTKPRARKAHGCDWCPEQIAVGEVHDTYVGIWDGDFGQIRMHADCYRAMLADPYCDSEYMCGELHARGQSCD